MTVCYAMQAIPALLNGEWRMYCKPDNGDAFSYGLVVSNATMQNGTTGTFDAAPRVLGKYKAVDGRIFLEEVSYYILLSLLYYIYYYYCII